MARGPQDIEQLTRQGRQLDKQLRRLTDLVTARARANQLEAEIAGIAVTGEPTAPQAFRPKEAAAYVGLAYTTFRDYVRDGLIPPGVNDGKGRMLHFRKHLDAYLRQIEKEG